MSAIKSRIADLEQYSRGAVRRQFTDAELAVRLVNIHNNPERSSEMEDLRSTYLAEKRSGCAWLHVAAGAIVEWQRGPPRMLGSGDSRYQNADGSTTESASLLS